MLSVGLKPLYIVYFFFIIASLLSINAVDSKYYYIFTLFSFSLMNFFTLFLSTKEVILNKNSFLFFILLFLCLIFGIVYISEPMKFVIFYMFVSIAIYFTNYRVPIDKLIDFINITYLIYFILSVINYYFFLSPIRSGFVMNIGIISFDSFRGLQGSLADIDSYSVIIILLNIFLNKSKNKSFYILVGLIALLWTTRLTPILILCISLISFFMVKNKIMALVFLLLLIFGFFSSIYIGLYYPDNYFFVDNISNGKILNLVTHGRSIIWINQFTSIVDNFTLMHYIFGNLKYAEVDIYWSDGSTINPHNSFINLYFRTGLLSVIMILYLLIKIINTYSRKTFPIILGIFLAAMSNVTIFYVANPIYLILLYYLTYNYTENLKGKFI